MSQPVPQSELPTCQVCKLQPLPQSTQYPMFIILELLLAFISIKFSIIALLLGYMLCKTIWICPLCKRNVDVSEGKVFPTQHHIILRLNDCMVLMQKTKFRIISSILISLLVYKFITEPSYQYKPRVHISQNWRSLVTNCGYDVYIQNSFKFNYLYSLYEETTNWELQGIFLSGDVTDKLGYLRLKIKMNPTQSKDPNAEDIEVFIKNQQLKLQKGDVIKIKGQWSGHRHHIFIFVASSVHNTGKKIIDLQKQVQVLSHGLLRLHNF